MASENPECPATGLLAGWQPLQPCCTSNLVVVTRIHFHNKCRTVTCTTVTIPRSLPVPPRYARYQYPIPLVRASLRSAAPPPLPRYVSLPKSARSRYALVTLRDLVTILSLRLVTKIGSFSLRPRYTCISLPWILVTIPPGTRLLLLPLH